MYVCSHTKAGHAKQITYMFNLPLDLLAQFIRSGLFEARNIGAFRPLSWEM